MQAELEAEAAVVRPRRYLRAKRSLRPGEEIHRSPSPPPRRSARIAETGTLWTDAMAARRPPVEGHPKSTNECDACAAPFFGEKPYVCLCCQGSFCDVCVSGIDWRAVGGGSGHRRCKWGALSIGRRSLGNKEELFWCDNSRCLYELVELNRLNEGVWQFRLSDSRPV